jgi:hypothetical protein
VKFEPTFEIHTADPLGFVECPFIMTTAYTKDGAYPQGEWFLVVPEGKGIVLAQRVRLDVPDFSENLIKVDAKFLLSELLEQAKLRLRGYIFETRGSDSLALLSKRLETLPSNEGLLVSYHMRGIFDSCLDEISSRTKCPALSEFLTSVLELPRFTFI